MNGLHRDGPTLLVIEDDEATRSGMKRLLEMSSYHVAVVATEQEARMVASLEPPDLILLDANLPPPASLLAAYQIRQHPELCDVPVVVISVHDNTELDEFTVGYIADVSRFDQLEELIERLLLNH